MTRNDQASAVAAGSGTTVCALCEGTDLRPAGSARGLTVWVCRGCGLGCIPDYSAPEPGKDDYHHAGYYAHWDVDRERRESQWTARLDGLERLMPGRGRVLDVGCGLGTFLGMARRRGWGVLGTEVSGYGAERARQEQGIEVHVGFVRNMDLPEADFDVVTLWHVLEHVPNPRTFLGACRKLLRPGGLLLVEVPNTDYLGDIIRGRRFLPHPNEDHRFFYRDRTLTRMLETCGFQVQEVRSGDPEFRLHLPPQSAAKRAFFALVDASEKLSGRVLGLTLRAHARRT